MGIKYNNPLNGGKYFYVFFFFTALLYDFIPSYHSIFIVLLVLLFRVTRISRVYAFAAMFLVSYVLQSISFRTNKSNILHSFVLNFQVCKIKDTISFKSNSTIRHIFPVVSHNVLESNEYAKFLSNSSMFYSLNAILISSINVRKNKRKILERNPPSASNSNFPYRVNIEMSVA